MKRKFLFLQGPVGPFFGLLARQMQNAGHDIVKVNFNGGDEYFFSKAHITGTSVDYEQDLGNWPEFIRNLAKSANITDLIIYGDCRPVHKMAVAALKPEGIKVHVLEEGYFRPHWVTYEPDGVNDYSSLPRDAEFYKTQELEKLEETPQVGPTFGILAWYVTQYYFAHLYYSFRGRFTKYKLHFAQGNHHKAFWPWVPKLLQKPFLKIEAFFLQKKILSEKFFLVPLQLCRDFQITEHSDFANMEEFIKYAVANFALSAPDDVKLVIKNHPLDPSFNAQRNYVKKAAEANNITGRVIFIDGGHLPTLLDSARGVITVNSTAGLQAIHHNVPTLVLGRCFYAVEGLVNKAAIAEFLNDPRHPDMELYKRFRNYVMRKTQISGSFYEQKGMERAAIKLANKLAAS